MKDYFDLKSLRSYVFLNGKIIRIAIKSRDSENFDCKYL